MARTELLKAATSDNAITQIEIDTRSVSLLDIKTDGFFTHKCHDLPQFPAIVHPCNIHTEEASEE